MQHKSFEKDFLVFCSSYYQFGSRYVYDEKWSILRLVQKENTGMHYRSENIIEKCSLSVGKNYVGDVLGMCVVPQLFFYLGYFAALWSRLAEIGIRTTFIVFTLISSLLFDALDERMEEIAKKASIDQEYIKQTMVMELNELRRHYDLVCQLVEQINRAFGFVLLLITGHDFSIAIMDFSNILDHLEVGQEWFKHSNLFVHESRGPEQFEGADFFLDPLFEGKYVFLRSNPFKTVQFAHPIFRYLFLLVVSHRVGLMVPTHNIFSCSISMLYVL